MRKEKHRPKIYPYKSTLEYKVAKEYLTNYLYEPKESIVTYQVPHEYNPDFVHPNQPDILIECKGFFIKGFSDAQKYLAVIRDNPDKELVFVFSDPNKKAYAQCRSRKDGSFMTLAEWCEKNYIIYFTPETLPRDLIKGRWNLDDLRRYKDKFFGN